MPWVEALKNPDGDFFAAYSAALKAHGPMACVEAAVIHLTPRVDWAGYLPGMPHGLLGLDAALELRPLLSERRFHRLLGLQLHAFAMEGRAKRRAKPSSEAATEAAFRELLAQAAPDMANIGHKAVAAATALRLWQRLGQGEDAGRALLAWARFVVMAEPVDRFWNVRMARRLESGLPSQTRVLGEAWQQAFAESMDEVGLVALLDQVAERLREGPSTEDLLAALSLAACDKQLAATRDLEGKTAWNFVYLAALACELPAREQPEVWGQAAALVNFFPAEAWLNDPWSEISTTGDLLEAILDGEPDRALERALGYEDPAEALKILAEAACLNDPGFNHAMQILAVASAVRCPLPPKAARRRVGALAKFLGNTQGQDYFGRQVERALEGEVPSEL